MSKSFEFQGAEAFEQHHCDAIREGEWLIFRCPECDYERRFNRNTGEMKVRQGPEHVLHEGQYMPFGGMHSN